MQVPACSDKEMQVRLNDKDSYRPQWTLVGLYIYYVQSIDNNDCLDKDVRFQSSQSFDLFSFSSLQS